VFEAELEEGLIQTQHYSPPNSGLN
jgi:hypothetical protein